MSGATFGDPALPAVVMLHGFLGRGEDWAPIAASMATHHYVYCPDLPGHADQTFAYGATFNDVTEALQHQIAAKGISRFALVGYSMGGRLALHYAITYPEQVTRLVLESASPGIPDEPTRLSRIHHDDLLAAELDAITNAEEMEAWLRDWYDSPLWDSLRKRPELLEREIAKRRTENPQPLAAALRALSPGRQPSLWEALPALHVNTLYVHGEEDSKYAAIGEQMAECSPRIVRMGITGCGHNVHLEAPEAYTTLIKPFLAE